MKDTIYHNYHNPDCDRNPDRSRVLALIIAVLGNNTPETIKEYLDSLIVYIKHLLNQLGLDLIDEWEVLLKASICYKNYIDAKETGRDIENHQMVFESMTLKVVMEMHFQGYGNAFP